MSSLLCHTDRSQLIMVDLQPRLLAAMPDQDRVALLRVARVLGRTAGLLDIPVTITEQYPKGLGTTEEEILAVLPEGFRRFEKTGFSCCEAEGLRPAIEVTGRKQAILIGVETHVCVLQSAIDIAALGFNVFVLEDGVCSRDPANKRNALERMRQAGIVVTNLESVLFEWLTDAAHPHFKAVSAMIR